jgi:hypothetical protein
MDTQQIRTNSAAFANLAEMRRTETGHGQSAEAKIDMTGKAAFESLANLQKGSRAVSVAVAAKTLAARLQRQRAQQSGRKKVKKNDLASIAQKLIEQMSTDGDKEDLSDQRRDPLEMFAAYEAAQDMLAGKLKHEDPEDQQALDELLQRLPQSEKQSLSAQLAARKTTIEEAGGKNFEAARDARNTLQSVFDELAASGASPHMMEKLRSLFTGEDGAFSGYTMAAAIEIYFPEQFPTAMANTQKLNDGAMRQDLSQGRRTASQQRPVSITLGAAYAFIQMQSSFRVAQKLRNELRNALKHPPRHGVGKLTVLLLEVAQTAISDADKLQKAASASPKLLPQDKLGEICRAFRDAVRELPTHWWPEGGANARLTLIGALDDKFKETQSGVTREQKTAESKEAQLRDPFVPKARL